jgi:hypothetical protein
MTCLPKDGFCHVLSKTSAKEESLIVHTGERSMQGKQRGRSEAKGGGSTSYHRRLL